MRGAVAWILGIALAANGLVMLGAPAAWYAAVPGVDATGPFNAHFIRDIGVAYVLCGAALPWFAISPAARPAAVIGAAFLALHAAVHLWDAAAGGKVASLGRYHKDAPLAAYHAVRIVGTLAEDCGPCTQLTVDMAVRAGVHPAVLRAVVSRDFSAMPADVSLAVRFAEASLRHAPEAHDLRKEVVRRWGKRALISLAFAITGARIFPTVKYAMRPRPRLHPRDRRWRVAAGAS